MLRLILRRVAAALAFVVLALSGCGGGSDAAVAPEPTETRAQASPETAAPTPVVEPEQTAAAEPTATAEPESGPVVLGVDGLPVFSSESGLTLRGVNLAGAEFGDNRLPGEYDVAWTFPTYEEVDFFTQAGMNVLRLPFRWERLQPELGGAFDDNHVALLDEFVRYANEQGAVALLDVHNYAGYYDETIGSDAVPITEFAAFWAELAGRYADQPGVIFGLMNEPIGIDSAVWIQAANSALASIRDTGANNLVLVPGNYWTGAHSWFNDGSGMANAEALLQIVDPADNWVVEVHQYLDSDHSGTSASCVSETAGPERLDDFTDWLYEHGLRGFLGEFGAGENDTCLAALDAMLDHIEENSSVWLGWTYWAAGPWWGDYIFEVEPTAGISDDPQFDILSEYLPAD